MHVKWKQIDITTWERRSTFEGFRKCDFPFLVVGTNIHLGNSRSFWKEHNLSPYSACIYAVCSAVNDVPAFRQRIRGDTLIEHEIVHANFTIAKGTESFGVKQIAFDRNFESFQKNMTESHHSTFIAPGELKEGDHWVFMSCLPWIAFTHMVQPMISFKDDSIPRIVWGKFSDDGKLPISIQAHHSLVDGFHVAQFIERLESYFATPHESFRSLVLFGAS